MVFLRAHLSPPLVPSVSPSGVRVERLNSTAMNVSWTLLTLEEARGFVISYTVSYKKDEGMAKRTTESVVVPGGEQSSVVIGGLDPGSSYLVSVSASTSAGTGEMSEEIMVSTLPPDTSTGGSIQFSFNVLYFFESVYFLPLQCYTLSLHRLLQY